MDFSWILKPLQAIGWFKRNAARLIPKWSSLVSSAEDRAEKVSKATKLDLINQVMNNIDAAIENGVSQEEFKKNMTDMIQKQWGEAPSNRIDMVFRNNVLDAYNAGRQEIMDAALETHPYRRFDATIDPRTTVICRACNGVVLPANDPWWLTHSPKLHFGCRSILVPLREKDALAHGITQNPPQIEPQAGFGAPPNQQLEMNLEYKKDNRNPALHGITTLSSLGLPDFWLFDESKIKRDERGRFASKSGAEHQAEAQKSISKKVAKRAPVAVGTHIKGVSGNGKEHAEEIMKHFHEIGLGKILRKAPISEMVMSKKLKIDGHPDIDPLGAYNYDSGKLYIKIPPKESYNLPFVPGESFSVAKSATSKGEVVKRTATHEVAHHLWDQTPDNLKAMVVRAYKRGNPITSYAAISPTEYLAETFAAYHFHPDELKKHDPVGWNMLQHVMGHHELVDYKRLIPGVTKEKHPEVRDWPPKEDDKLSEGAEPVDKPKKAKKEAKPNLPEKPESSKPVETPEAQKIEEKTPRIEAPKEDIQPKKESKSPEIKEPEPKKEPEKTGLIPKKNPAPNKVQKKQMMDEIGRRYLENVEDIKAKAPRENWAMALAFSRGIIADRVAQEMGLERPNVREIDKAIEKAKSAQAKPEEKTVEPKTEAPKEEPKAEPAPKKYPKAAPRKAETPQYPKEDSLAAKPATPKEAKAPNYPKEGDLKTKQAEPRKAATPSLPTQKDVEEQDKKLLQNKPATPRKSVSEEQKNLEEAKAKEEAAKVKQKEAYKKGSNLKERGAIGKEVAEAEKARKEAEKKALTAPKGQVKAPNYPTMEQVDAQAPKAATPRKAKPANYPTTEEADKMTVKPKPAAPKTGVAKPNYPTETEAEKITEKPKAPASPRKAKEPNYPRKSDEEIEKGKEGQTVDPNKVITNPKTGNSIKALDWQNKIHESFHEFMDRELPRKVDIISQTQRLPRHHVKELLLARKIHEIDKEAQEKGKAIPEIAALLKPSRDRALHEFQALKNERESKGESLNLNKAQIDAWGEGHEHASKQPVISNEPAAKVLGEHIPSTPTVATNKYGHTHRAEGNTFKAKDVLKSAGFKWDPDSKAWTGGPEEMKELDRISSGSYSRSNAKSMEGVEIKPL